MFRVKKLLFYTIFLITGVLFLLCIQNRFRINSYNTKDDNEKPKLLFPSSINNAKIRKLAEKETIKISLKNFTISTSKISIHNDITTSTKLSTTTTTTTSATTVSSTDSEVSVSDRPWYMIGGERRPNHDDQPLPIFPEDLPSSDRIPEQLMYLPPAAKLYKTLSESEVPLKKILLWNGASSWNGLKPGRGVFLKEECPVSSCALVSSRSEAERADLVIFKDHFTMPTFDRPSYQKWMLYLLECPLHTQMFKFPSVFNWTATYRRDSTVVTPYERWQYYNDKIRTKVQEKNFAQNKTKQVAWFVSNCGARNGRLNYARELGKYINVDIFGACGPHRCPRTSANKCFQLLDDDYKFYLAFENSNCKDYISEKFFVNGLGHDILPIAMGARLEDYEEAAPRKSFLHVDQFSGPEELAKFLHKLDQDDSLYNEYFKWKGTGEFINTKFWCRVCALLHEEKPRETPHSWYPDINEWWRGSGTCADTGWRPTHVSHVSNRTTRVHSWSPPGHPVSSNKRWSVLMEDSRS